MDIPYYIQIMRAFTKLREMLSIHDELKKQIDTMEKRYDENFKIVFEAIRQLIETDTRAKKIYPVKFMAAA